MGVGKEVGLLTLQRHPVAVGGRPTGRDSIASYRPLIVRTVPIEAYQTVLKSSCFARLSFGWVLRKLNLARDFKDFLSGMEIK